MGGLLGGGGKGYVGPPPLSNYWGGGWPPLPPPPSSYAYADILWTSTSSFQEYWLSSVSLSFKLFYSHWLKVCKADKYVFFSVAIRAGCSKLTVLLVHISLKFQKLISNIHQYFLLKKCEKFLQCKSFSHFSTKNIIVFGNKVIKHLTR